MTRKEYIQFLLKGSLVTMLPFSSILSSCGGEKTISEEQNIKDVFVQYLKDDKLSFLKTIVDTILPKTTTVSASEVGVHHFIDLYVKYCFSEARQRSFIKNLQEYKGYLESKKLNLFEPSESLMKQLQKDENNNEKSFAEKQSCLRTIKELTIKGYFSTEKGVKENLFYKPIPGKYEGCLPIEKNIKAWVN